MNHSTWAATGFIAGVVATLVVGWRLFLRAWDS